MLFTGREWLKDLKLYDYRARLYNPELGRFMQPDPKQFAAGDYNLYRYCHNDPVNRTDPTGLQDEKPTLVREERLRYGVPTGSHLPQWTSSVRYTFVPTNSWVSAAMAGAKAASPYAKTDNMEYHGEACQSDTDRHKFIAGPFVQGGRGELVPGSHRNWNLSNLGSGPVPQGYHSVGSYWAISKWIPLGSWPTHDNGETDRDRLVNAHMNAVLAVPPQDGDQHGAITFRIYEDHPVD